MSGRGAQLAETLASFLSATAGRFEYGHLFAGVVWKEFCWCGCGGMISTLLSPEGTTLVGVVCFRTDGRDVMFRIGFQA
ncbi:hypothetical protein, partial [Verrucosispora sp. SN26_14.1]|uniref:hypothetical protein n=1 Tax=Verrucosispora sp. SN26_14.1 TaxID=2527879 RepID=UPI001F35BB3C